jgi:hypothetical protein
MTETQRLKHIEREIESARVGMNLLAKKIEGLRNEAAGILARFKKNDIIMSESSVMIVDSVRSESFVCSDPLYKVTLIKADGSLGEQINLIDSARWELADMDKDDLLWLAQYHKGE